MPPAIIRDLEIRMSQTDQNKENEYVTTSKVPLKYLFKPFEPLSLYFLLEKKKDSEGG